MFLAAPTSTATTSAQPPQQPTPEIGKPATPSKPADTVVTTSAATVSSANCCFTLLLFSSN